MMSKIPVDLEKLKGKLRDAEIARVGIIAELDAISLYEQLAALAESKLLRKVLLDIANEEKTHVGEFLEMLKRLDREQEKELERGRDEVVEMGENSPE